MNTQHELERMLSRDLHDQVDGMSDLPFGLSDVQGRARRIRRNRRIVAGVGVADGYWNRPELTQERFFTTTLPGQGPVRGYRTGDLARRRMVAKAGGCDLAGPQAPPAARSRLRSIRHSRTRAWSPDVRTSGTPKSRHCAGRV